MKILQLPVALVSSALLLSACESSDPQQRAAEQRQELEAKKPPYVGMTKDQVLARYGEPKTRVATDSGEMWTYFLNEGEVLGSALIPFNFDRTKPNIATLTFGPHGKVQHFAWVNPQKDD